MVIQVCSTFLTRHPEQFGLYTSKSEGPQDNALEVGKRGKWSTHLEEAPKHSDGRARSDRRQALPGVTWSISALRPEPWTPAP